MKFTKIIALFCVITLLLSSIAVFAETKYEIAYKSVVSNPAVKLPIRETAQMKNGLSVTEFESDWVYDNSILKLTEDYGASGRRALQMQVPGNKWASDEAARDAIKNPTIMLDLNVDKGGFYTMWVRSKGGTFSWWFSDDGGKTYKVHGGTGDNNDFTWSKVWSNKVMSPGLYNFSIKYRNPTGRFDKCIITDNADFVPVGADDVPAEVEESWIYPLPEITPPENVHPRLFVTKEDVPELRKKVDTELLKTVWSTVKRNGTRELDCKLPVATVSYNNNALAALQARAFLYVMGEVDIEHAKETISHMKDYVETSIWPEGTGENRNKGFEQLTVAVVYDWCYDAMTDADKAYFIRKAKELAIHKEIGYPPVKAGAVTGIGTEGDVFQDLIPLGIAVYDEEPEIYNLSVGKFFAAMQEGLKFFYQSGLNQNGTYYPLTRYEYAIFAIYALQGIGVEEPLGDLTKLGIRWIYERTPINKFFKTGDTNWTKFIPYKYDTEDRSLMMSGAEIHKDPYLQRQYLLEQSILNYGTRQFYVFPIIFSDPWVEIKEYNDLPLWRRTTYPFSTMVARTNWQAGLEAPTAMAYMNMYELALPGEHSHTDTGSFQIFYKGMLALDTGVYHTYGNPHYQDYSMRSIAHNTISVYDPEQKFMLGQQNWDLSKQSSNDGGQIPSYWPYTTPTFESTSEQEHFKKSKEVVAYAGPNNMTPAFSYIKGDITGAYSADLYDADGNKLPASTDKVVSYERSMVFLDLFEEDYPAAFIVYDDVTSKNKNFKKSWILHSQNEPEVSDNITTITRTEHGLNGKLVNTSLLPSQQSTEKIGGEGKEFWVDGKNYQVADSYIEALDTEKYMSDAGQWRIEISPSTPAANDKFLNVMYVCDADGNLGYLPSYKDVTADYVAATIKDRFVTFPATTSVISKAFNLSVRENGFDTMSCLITGVNVGMWKISNGITEFYVESKEGENVLCFNAVPGNYTVSPAPGAVATLFDYPQMYKTNVGDFMTYNASTGLMIYQPKPFKLVNDVPYFPVYEMADYFGGSASKTDNSVTFTVGDNTLTVTAGTKTSNLNGATRSLLHEPQIIDGTLYACLYDYANILSKQITYDRYAQVVKFTDKVSNIPGVGNIEIIPVVQVDASTAGTSVAENAVDMDLSTYWASLEGDNEWILFDFGKEYDVSKVLISFYQGTKRTQKFDIQYSNDGKNFTTVFSGDSNGKTDDLQTFEVNFKARYVKLGCYGNSKNLFNSLSEVIFAK